ncbi:MAG: carbon storage regulator [Planctomycetaceae bacterium]|nr:carbon storage regulator [Planctomycetaceae bacterium]
MLVLSRKKGESIQIADNISITVTEVKGGRVRLSIEAPRSVRILRGELTDSLPEVTEFVDVDLSSILNLPR